MLKNTLREHLLRTCSDTELRQWFDPLELTLSETEKKLSVSFPHPFFAQWFQSTIQEKFEEQLSFFFEPGFVLRYRRPFLGGNGGSAGGGLELEKQIDYPFGRTFTFENFISNRKNSFPLATSRQVAVGEAVQYNPFVLCGPSGTGKTHLLKAIANTVCKKSDRGDIFIGAIDDLVTVYNVQFGGDLFKARTHFQTFTYLLVDDFQQIKEHADFQDELVALFNLFHDNKKQMVFCCTDKITSYSFLGPKLKSRLEWGLVVNLMGPDLDVRIEYITRQCAKKKVALSRDQILTLAQRFTDFRTLQGILLKLSAFKELMGKEIRDMEFEKVLKHAEDKPAHVPQPEAVMNAVCEHFDVARKDLVGEKRHHKIVLARQTAMFLCRDIIGCSYPVLGRLFGGKDHSTAMYAVKKINKLMNENKDIKKLVTGLKKTCSKAEEN